MAEIFLSLGSNMGDPEANLALAQARLQNQGWIRIVQGSPMVVSEPWGDVPQGWFLNQVVRAETGLPPRPLMQWLSAIERDMGRDRAQEVRWGPRVIDIDVLAYGDQSYSDPRITVPHPRLQERRFVLVPWATIAPDWKHPALGRTVAELLEEAEDTRQVHFYR